MENYGESNFLEATVTLNNQEHLGEFGWLYNIHCMQVTNLVDLGFQGDRIIST